MKSSYSANLLIRKIEILPIIINLFNESTFLTILTRTICLLLKILSKNVKSSFNAIFLAVELVLLAIIFYLFNELANFTCFIQNFLLKESLEVLCAFMHPIVFRLLS